MKPEWEREYSREDTQCWNLRAESFQITVLNYHRHYPGKWVMHAFVFQIDTRVLKASSAEEAKAESIKIVKDVVEKYVDDIIKIEGEESKHQELNGG